VEEIYVLFIGELDNDDCRALLLAEERDLVFSMMFVFISKLAENISCR
jgi:hypothetical protein